MGNVPRFLGQKVGKRWRFHREAIGEWLKQHPVVVAGSQSPSISRNVGC